MNAEYKILKQVLDELRYKKLMLELPGPLIDESIASLSNLLSVYRKSLNTSEYITGVLPLFGIFNPRVEQ